MEPIFKIKKFIKCNQNIPFTRSWHQEQLGKYILDLYGGIYQNKGQQTPISFIRFNLVFTAVKMYEAITLRKPLDLPESELNNKYKYFKNNTTFKISNNLIYNDRVFKMFSKLDYFGIVFENKGDYADYSKEVLPRSLYYDHLLSDKFDELNERYYPIVNRTINQSDEEIIKYIKDSLNRLNCKCLKNVNDRYDICNESISISE